MIEDLLNPNLFLSLMLVLFSIGFVRGVFMLGRRMPAWILVWRGFAVLWISFLLFR